MGIRRHQTGIIGGAIRTITNWITLKLERKVTGKGIKAKLGISETSMSYVWTRWKNGKMAVPGYPNPKKG
jgi:hypothetical protein